MEALVRLRLSLGGGSLMLHPAFLDCLLLDLLSLLQDSRAAPEVDVGRCQVGQAFVIPVVVVPLLIGVCDRQLPGRQVFVFPRKVDHILANRVRDAAPDRSGPG